MSDGWACELTGACELVPRMDLSRVEVLVNTETHRLFRYTKSGARLDTVLAWGEYKGSAMIIWSTLKSRASGEITRPSEPEQPARRTLRFTLPRVRDKARNFGITVALRNCLRTPSPYMKGLGYRKSIKIKDTPAETIWHIVKSLPAQDH